MNYIKKTTGYVLTRSEESRLNPQTHVAKAQQINDTLFSGSPYYVVFGSAGACDLCVSKHGIAYHVSDAVPGETYPPFHPNCKCNVRPYDDLDQISLPHTNPFEHPSFGPNPNDWRFFGWNGDEFTDTPHELYTDDYFGKPIEPGEHEELHVVDWLARILFHETGEEETQAAILWCIMNRYLSDENFTYGEPNTLMNILNASGAYEVFNPDNNSPQQQNANSPLEWIREHPTFSSNGKSTKAAWGNAISLAKKLVSIYGNGNLTNEQKRELFEQWVPNPFPEGIDPYQVAFHVGQGYGSDVFFIPVGDSWFGYTYR
jgi:hypothetical protein